jgi:putative DNA primase/helicase
LVTPSENAEVIKSLIGIAEARGWKHITVSGTERFRRQAWGAARELGLEVRGYAPTEFELAQQNRKAAAPAPAAGAAEQAADHESKSPRERESTRNDRSKSLITGRLIDHGVATYRHDAREPLSYFVKVETPDGEREIWGIDLKRALKESLTQPKIGDLVGLRALRREAVTVRDGEKPLVAHRNRWIVERQEFFDERAAAAKTLRDPTVDPKHAARQHPELIGTYLQMHAAQIAARQFSNPQDQEMFVSRVRSALAERVASGEALPSVQLKEKTATRVPEPARAEEAPTR